MASNDAITYSSPSPAFELLDKKIRREMFNWQLGETGPNLLDKRVAREAITFGIATAAVAVVATVTYYQRVWDEDDSVYCYYSKTSIDPTPAGGDTVPVHGGNINTHAVLFSI